MFHRLGGHSPSPPGVGLLPGHHPAWCGRGHLCTVDLRGPGGQHRSAPHTVDTPAGPVILTRTCRGDGAGNTMEIRAVVDLPPDPGRAQHLAGRFTRRLIQALDLSPAARTVRP